MKDNNNDSNMINMISEVLTFEKEEQYINKIFYQKLLFQDLIMRIMDIYSA